QVDRRVEQGAFDSPSDCMRLVPGRWSRHTALEGERQVRLDDTQRHEEPRDGRAAVYAPDRVGHAAKGRRLVDLLEAHRLADDEAGDQVALRTDEGGDLR